MVVYIFIVYFILNFQGVDEFGTSYEDKFCLGSGQRGVAILGDSASAHFHIPLEWANSSYISEVCSMVIYIIYVEIERILEIIPFSLQFCTKMSAYIVFGKSLYIKI